MSQDQRVCGHIGDCECVHTCLRDPTNARRGQEFPPNSQERHHQRLVHEKGLFLQLSLLSKEISLTPKSQKTQKFTRFHLLRNAILSPAALSHSLYLYPRLLLYRLYMYVHIVYFLHIDVNIPQMCTCWLFVDIQDQC